MLAAEERVAVESAGASADLDALVRRAKATSIVSTSISRRFPVSVSTAAQPAMLAEKHTSVPRLECSDHVGTALKG